jgi:8-oxo-dGTP diphosphatase
MKRVLKVFLALLFVPISLTATSESPPYPKDYYPSVVGASAIVEIYHENEFKGIALIERGKAPYGYAFPAGKVEYAESVEDGVKRELREETNLSLYDVRQFHVYSDPDPDFRFALVEVSFLAKSNGHPVAGDDAAEAYIFALEDIPKDKMITRHQRILDDYLSYRKQMDDHESEMDSCMLFPTK